MRSSPNGGGSLSVRRSGRHDLPRLPGDDPGGAGGGGGDDAVDRGQVRQSTFAVSLGEKKGSSGLVLSVAHRSRPEHVLWQTTET